MDSTSQVNPYEYAGSTSLPDVLREPPVQVEPESTLDDIARDLRTTASCMWACIAAAGVMVVFFVGMAGLVFAIVPAPARGTFQFYFVLGQFILGAVMELLFVVILGQYLRKILVFQREVGTKRLEQVFAAGQDFWHYMVAATGIVLIVTILEILGVAGVLSF